MTAPSPWWMPDRHQDRRHFLVQRGKAKSAIRSYFLSEGFIEVETACLQVSPGNETHLHAFRTELVGTALDRREMYLHTSPEFAMKKLLSAGETKIFSFAPCFRNRERGALHSPEFTMLEWYRADTPYRELWEDCKSILAAVAAATERTVWSYRDARSDVVSAHAHLTVEDAFSNFAGFRLSESYSAASADRDALARDACRQNIVVQPDDTWSDIFSRVLVERVESQLGSPHPTFLYEYPVHEAALARPVPGRPSVAERFELYVAGIELANGFGELTDAVEQRRRFETDMRAKESIYGERYPIDGDFIDALMHMPPASGCALGFDRLVMLATGATSIDQVIWTPLPEML